MLVHVWSPAQRGGSPLPGVFRDARAGRIPPGLPDGGGAARGAPIDTWTTPHERWSPPPGRRPRASPPPTSWPCSRPTRAGWRRVLERLLDDDRGPPRRRPPARRPRARPGRRRLRGRARPPRGGLRPADRGRRRRRRRARRRRPGRARSGSRRRGPAGEVVVWAAGPEHRPGRPRRAGRPARGASAARPSAGASTAGVPLPGGRAGRRAVDPGRRGARLARRRRRRPRAATASASSVTWLGRVAVAAVRLVARGAVVPALRGQQAPRRARRSTCSVRWSPALVDDAELDALAGAMPGPGRRPGPTPTRATVTLDVLGAVVDAIVRDAAGRARAARAAAGHPHHRRRWPRPSSPGSTARRSRPRSRPAPRSRKRLDRWAKPVTGTGRPRLVVQLDPPDRGDAWFLSVLGPGAEGGLLPIEAGARRQPGRPSRWPTSWPASSASCPRCCAPAACAAARCT